MRKMEISGPNAPQPNYQDQFVRSVKLFEESFQKVEKAEFDAKREKYVDVMKESLQVMHHAANGMLNTHLTELKEKLAKDLETYLEQPNDATRSQVNSDIRTIKNS